MGANRIIHGNGNGHHGIGRDSHYITRAEARAIAEERAFAEEIAVKVTEHYFKQVPAHVTGQINGALVAYGLVELRPVELPPLSGSIEPEALPESAETRENTGPLATSPDTIAPSEEPAA